MPWQPANSQTYEAVLDQLTTDHRHERALQRTAVLAQIEKTPSQPMEYDQDKILLFRAGDIAQW